MLIWIKRAACVFTLTGGMQEAVSFEQHDAEPLSHHHALPNSTEKIEFDLIEEVQVLNAEETSEILVDQERPSSATFGTIYSISRQQIERMGARNLVDILEMAPSATVSMNTLGYYRLALRGVREDSRILFLIDGQRSENPYNSRAYWNINAAHIERVDIYYGAGPLSAGYGDLDGAVNIITRREDGVSIQLFGGSFLTFGSAAATGVDTRRLSTHMALSAQYEEGPQLNIERDRFTPYPRGTQPRLQTSARRSAFGLTADLDVLVTPIWETHAFANGHLFAESRGPYMGLADAVGPGSQLQWLNWGVDGGVYLGEKAPKPVVWRVYAGQHFINDVLQLTPSGYSPTGSGTLSQDSFPDGIQSSSSYMTLQMGSAVESQMVFAELYTVTIGAFVDSIGVVQNAFQFRMNRSLDAKPSEFISIGELAEKQNTPCRPFGAAQPVWGVCRVSVGLYGETVLTLLPQLSLVLGTRLVLMDDVAMSWRNNFLPQVRLIVKPVNGLILELVGMTSVRPPTFEERFDDTARAYVDVIPGLFVGLNSLRPETSSSLEWRMAYAQILQGWRYGLHVNTFYWRIDDTIDRIEKLGGTNTYSNEATTETVGLDGGLDVRLGTQTNFFVNASWTRSYYREYDEQGNSKCRAFFFEPNGSRPDCLMLTHIPQIRATLGVNADFRKWGNLFVVSNVFAARQNNVRSRLEWQRPYQIPPFALVQVAYTTAKLWNHVVLQFSVFNLFDTVRKDDVVRPDHMPGYLPREGIYFYATASYVL